MSAKKPTQHDKLDTIIAILTKEGTGPEHMQHSGGPITVTQPVPPKPYAEMMKQWANGDIVKFADVIVANAHWIYNTADPTFSAVLAFMSEYPRLFSYTGSGWVRA